VAKLFFWHTMATFEFALIPHGTICKLSQPTMTDYSFFPKKNYNFTFMFHHITFLIQKNYNFTIIFKQITFLTKKKKKKKNTFQNVLTNQTSSSVTTNGNFSGEYFLFLFFLNCHWSLVNVFEYITKGTDVTDREQ
jgi:hypothetical protein